MPLAAWAQFANRIAEAIRSSLASIAAFGVMNFLIVLGAMVTAILTLATIYGFGLVLNRGVSAESFRKHDENMMQILRSLEQRAIDDSIRREEHERRQDIWQLENCLQGAEQTDWAQSRCWLRYDGIPPPRPKVRK